MLRRLQQHTMRSTARPSKTPDTAATDIPIVCPVVSVLVLGLVEFAGPPVVVNCGVVVADGVDVAIVGISGADESLIARVLISIEVLVEVDTNVVIKGVDVGEAVSRIVVLEGVPGSSRVNALCVATTADGWPAQI